MHLLENGEVIDGRFQITGNLIDISGQSAYYLARDLQASPAEPWRQHVFFKQYHDVLPEHLSRMDLFFQEIGRRMTNHTGLVCIPLDRKPSNTDGARYEPVVGIAGKAVFAAYPWISDTTLKARLGDPLNEDAKVRIVFALLKTIRVLAKNEIAHLDLKPENIMIQERRDRLFIRLIDLDMARIDGRSLRNIGGTEFYMSPEHYSSRFGDVSLQSDVFALGILIPLILFECHPFKTAANYREAIENGRFVLPATNYHPDVIDLIKQCLTPDPVGRPTVAEIYTRFHKLYGTGLKYQRAGIAIAAGSNCHHYFESADLGRQALRIFKVPGMCGQALRLQIEPDRGYYSIEMLTESIKAKLNGKYELAPGRPIFLNNTNSLELNGVKFELTLIPY